MLVDEIILLCLCVGSGCVEFPRGQWTSFLTAYLHTEARERGDRQISTFVLSSTRNQPQKPPKLCKSFVHPQLLQRSSRRGKAAQYLFHYSTTRGYLLSELLLTESDHFLVVANGLKLMSVFSAILVTISFDRSYESIATWANFFYCCRWWWWSNSSPSISSTLLSHPSLFGSHPLSQSYNFRDREMVSTTELLPAVWCSSWE